MADDIQARIDEIVKSNKVVIFMKGTPDFPMCGFSQQAAAALHALGRPLKAVDVIGEPEFRQGIKDYSRWPTIPQVYVNGEFLGGSDIVRQMFESGDLEKTVDAAFADA